MNDIYLHWEGKESYNLKSTIEYDESILRLDTSIAEDLKNIIYHGDAREFLFFNKDCLKNMFQLIYIDPPFFTGNVFKYKDKSTGNGSQIAYIDKWSLGINEYLNLLYQSLLLISNVLKENGLIFIHVDYRVNAYTRILLDEVMGKSNFRNEIIWSYQTGGRAKKYFSRKHDSIYMYSKTNTYKFYPDAVGRKRGIEKRNNMKRNIDDNGKCYFSINSGNKVYRYYEDDLVHPSDVWSDISHMQQKDPQRTGYETQKPEKLMERIIKASTKEHDLVGDFFCGAGTTLAVAQKLNRRWIGCDNSQVAVSVSKSRLSHYMNSEDITIIKGG